MIQKTPFFLALLFTLIAVPSCATWSGAARIEGLNRPLIDIQRAVMNSLPLGKRRLADGAMEFYSNYFIIRGRDFVPADKKAQRYYAHIYILGDRRPYVVEVYVKKEQRLGTSKTDYREAGQDEELAKLIQIRIQNQLSKRREDSNVIDDFRVF